MVVCIYAVKTFIGNDGVSIQQEIGGLLAAAREDEQLTQKQVAEKLGVTRSEAEKVLCEMLGEDKNSEEG